MNIQFSYKNVSDKDKKFLENYPWSSYLDYVGLRKGTLGNKDIILNQFSHRDYIYKNFIDNCLLEMKNRSGVNKMKRPMTNILQLRL